jgi:hypothetical protein
MSRRITALSRLIMFSSDKKIRLNCVGHKMTA